MLFQFKNSVIREIFLPEKGNCYLLAKVAGCSPIQQPDTNSGQQLS
jgi:hypothetical protein